MRPTSRLAGYSFSVLVTILALVVGAVGPQTWNPTATYSFLLAAVMVSSWFSGVGPGLVSTVLGTLGADYYLFEPLHTITVDAARVIQLSAFVFVAILISSLNDAMRRTATALAHDRSERVKELTALHAIARLLNEERDTSDLLQRIADRLAVAYQYPDITAVRIVMGDLVVKSHGFRPTPWTLTAPFRISDDRPAAVEVVYLESRPTETEGPFLAEERSLIDSVASLLQSYFERLHGEAERLQLTRMEAARRESDEANQAKDRFLAMLSHELRAPLHVMLGWTRLIGSGQLAPDARVRGLEVLDRSITMQAKLIDDLLDVSRIVTGKLRVERQHTDVTRLASIAIDAARPAAAAKQIVFTAAVDPGLWVEADPARLQQVFANLFTNAFKFTPDGGTVSCSVSRQGEHVVIEITDTGLGIRPDLLPFVFDRFRQGDSSITRSHGGLGLGLSIVKRVIELHDGDIQVRSDGPGHGTSFNVRLPLAEALRSLAATDAPAMAADPLLDGIRVLVVDDEPDARLTLTAMLEHYGATTRAADSAETAYRAVMEERPDVLVSDIAMPGQDGYELMRRIRQQPSADLMPAAALSAYADTDHRDRALAAGFQVHLAKPIEPAVLAATVAHLASGAASTHLDADAAAPADSGAFPQ